MATGSSSSSSSSRSPPSSLTPIVEISRVRVRTPGTAVQQHPVTMTIKRETVGNEEIKEFAETAMNELLGLYGYGPSDAKKQCSRRSEGEGAAAAAATNNGGSGGGAGSASKKDLLLRHRQTRVVRVNDRPAAAPTTADTGTTGRAQSPPSLPNSPTSAANENYLAGEFSCDWCHRKINLEDETFGTTEGVRFCSEPCFAQSRRATFKRAKTCDWCRHVRHAVSYVDFQDGASQLQFCSDKCLNQYKMQIFIKETQAHLEMNPHLMEQGEGGKNLITPEMWMKNCKSRSPSPSPAPSRSRSVTPETIERDLQAQPAVPPTQPVNRPTITVAPVSKLLPPQKTQIKPAELLGTRPSMKTMRTKRRTLKNGPPVRDHHYHRPQLISPGTSGKIHLPQEVVGQPSTANDLQQFERRFLSPPPNLFPIRPNLMPGNSQMHRLQPQMDQSHPLPPLPNLRPSTATTTTNPNIQREFPGHPVFPSASPSPFMSTLLVPCPIILPIPVPIPIPINMKEFLEKLMGASKEESDRNNNNTTDEKKEPEPELSSPVDPLEVEKSESDEASENENESSREVAPRVKITRLQSRILTTREMESNRPLPLRKRKRMVVDAYT